MSKRKNKNTRKVRKSFNKVSRRRYNKRSVKKSNRRYKRTIKKTNKRIKKSINRRSKIKNKILQVGGMYDLGIGIRWAKEAEADAGGAAAQEDPFNNAQLESTFSEGHRQFFNAYVINFIKDKIMSVPQLGTDDTLNYRNLTERLGQHINEHYPFKGFFDGLGITVPEYQYSGAEQGAVADMIDSRSRHGRAAAAAAVAVDPPELKFGLIRHSESESNWLTNGVLEKYYGYTTPFLTPYGSALAFSTGYYKLYEEVVLNDEQLKLYCSTLPRSMITAMLLLRGLIKRINDELDKVPEEQREEHALNQYLSGLNREIKVVYGISEIPVSSPVPEKLYFDVVRKGSTPNTVVWAQRIMSGIMMVPMIDFINDTEGVDGIKLVLDRANKPVLWEPRNGEESYKSSKESLNRFFDKLYAPDETDTRHIFVVHGILMEKYVSWSFFIEYFKNINDPPDEDHERPRYTNIPGIPRDTLASVELASYKGNPADIINFNIMKILDYFIDLVNPKRMVFVGPFRCLKKKPTLRTWENRCVVIEGKSLNIYDDGDILGDSRGSSIDDITNAKVNLPDASTVSRPNFGLGNWELLTVNKEGSESVELAFDGVVLDTVHLGIMGTINYINEGNTLSWEEAMKDITDKNELAIEIENRWSKLLFFGSKRKCETIKALINNIHDFHSDIPELSNFKQQHYDKLLEIEYGIKLFIDYTMRVAMDLDSGRAEPDGLSSIMQVIDDPRHVGSEWLRGYSGVTMNDEEDQEAADAIDAAIIRASVAQDPAAAEEAVGTAVAAVRATVAAVRATVAAVEAEEEAEAGAPEDSIEQQREKFKKLMYAPLGKTPNNCSMVMGTLVGPRPRGELANYIISGAVEFQVGKNKTWIGGEGMILSIKANKLVLNTKAATPAPGAAWVEQLKKLTINLTHPYSFGDPKSTRKGHKYSLRLDVRVHPDECLETEGVRIPHDTFDDHVKIIIDTKTKEALDKLKSVLENLKKIGEHDHKTKDELRNIYLLHRLKDVKFLSPSLRFKINNIDYLRPTSEVPQYERLLSKIRANKPDDIQHSDSEIMELFDEVGEQLVEEQPVEEQPVEGQPVEGQPGLEED